MRSRLMLFLMGFAYFLQAQVAVDTVQLNAEIKKIPGLMATGKLTETITFIDQLLPKLATGFGPGHRKVVGIMGLKASIYEKAGDYPAAIASYKAAIQQSTLNKTAPAVAGHLHNGVGVLFWNLGKIDTAEYHFQNSLRLFEEAEGPNGKSLIIPLINIGMIKGARGEIDQALEIYKKNLVLTIANGGEIQYGAAVIYSNIGTLYINKGLTKEGLENMEKAASIMEKLYGPDSDNLPLILENIGSAELQLGNFNKYYTNNQRILQIRQKKLPSDHPLIGRALANMGAGKMLSGAFNEGFTLMKNGLNIIEKKQDKTNWESLALAHQALGVFYEQSGEVSKAIEYHTSSLNEFTKVHGTKNIHVANELANLAGNHYLDGALDEAILYYQQAANTFQQIGGKQSYGFAKAMENLGLVYLEKKQYTLAEEQFKLALFHYKTKTSNPNSPDVAGVYRNLSTLYLNRNELDSALWYINKTIETQAQLYTTPNPMMANVWTIKGECLEKMARYEAAEEAYQKAISIYESVHLNVADCASVRVKQGWIYLQRGDLSLAKRMFELAKNTLAKDLENNFEALPLRSKLFAMDIFSSLGSLYALKYTHSKLNSSLDSSNTYLILAETVAQSINLGYRDLYAKNRVKANARTINERLFNNYLLNPAGSLALEQVFSFSERARSFLLYENIQERQAINQLNVPDSLLQKEQEYKLGINYFDQKQMEWLNQGKDRKDSIYLAYSGKLFEFKQSYQNYQTALAQRYPNYIQLRENLSTASLTEVQKKLLQADQTLLEYFVGDSSIYIFLVQAEHYELVEIKKDPAFEQWVEDLTRKGIYGHYEKNRGILKDKALKNYGTAAFQLYQTLIAPVKAKLGKKVIIIPDDVLGYIPFEALLTQKPPRPDAIGAFNYLIQDHQISYCYSATLLREMRNKAHHPMPKENLLALAPFFLGKSDTLLSRIDTNYLLADLRLKDSLASLPESGAEVAAISKLFKGEAIYGSNASLSRFKDLAPNYRIIHLSTHGKADDRLGDYAYLAFGVPNAQGTFDKLYARDLYNLSLNADLVVLSACETGVGQLQRGEGIISLARAFAHAGAKSVVTTLWKVREKQSKDIVLAFYNYLLKGSPKDEALRLAKLEFLERNEKKTELLHPFFWASFIGIGDMKKL